MLSPHTEPERPEVTAGESTRSAHKTSTSSCARTHHLINFEITGNFQFFLTDALGTVRDVVDDAGDVIQSYEFNEHGLPMPGSGAGTGTFSPKTYQGALSVNDDRNDSGLYLMGHRHYAADLGRFISRDPIGFQGGLNLFAGHGVSPVTMVDALGLKPFGNPIAWFALEGEHINHRGNMGFTCSSSYNCHAYAIGAPSSPCEANEPFATPDQASHPLWNKDPSGELAKFYNPVQGGGYKVGDSLVYGSDLNGDGHLGGYQVASTGPGKGLPMSEIQHSAVIVAVDAKGRPTAAQSRQGDGIYRHNPFDPALTDYYRTENPVTGERYPAAFEHYRLKEGADPGRVWSNVENHCW